MKDEEMAEEIANKRCHEFMCYGHCSFNSPKHHRCGEWHREYNCALDGYHEGFKDCAKSRLNITTISDCPIKDEWHYVKDGNPDNENDILCQISKDEVEVGYYHTKQKRYYTIDGQPIDVIRWQEIVFPKESE